MNQRKMTEYERAFLFGALAGSYMTLLLMAFIAF